jgi:hypothetical protein
MFRQTTVHNFQPQFIKKLGEKSKWFKVCVECGKEIEQNDIYFHPPVAMNSMKDENSPHWPTQPAVYRKRLDCAVLQFARKRMFQNIQIILTHALRAEYEVESFRSDVLNFLPLRFCVIEFEDSEKDVPMILYRSTTAVHDAPKFAFVPLYEMNTITLTELLLSSVKTHAPLRRKIERKHYTVYGRLSVYSAGGDETKVKVKATIQNTGNNSIVHFESGESRPYESKYAIVEMNLQDNFV